MVSWCIRQQKLLKRVILRIFALLPNISFVSLFYQFAQFCTGALWWDPTATNMHTGHFSILMQLQEKLILKTFDQVIYNRGNDQT